MNPISKRHPFSANWKQIAGKESCVVSSEGTEEEIIIKHVDTYPYSETDTNTSY